LLFGSQRETFHGNIIQFSFAELENATENFSTSNLIGLGGSSYVYRGRLKDGSNVAVKRIKDQRGPEADSEFFTEVIPNLASVFFAWSCYIIMFHSVKINKRMSLKQFICLFRLNYCLDFIIAIWCHWWDTAQN